MIKSSQQLKDLIRNLSKEKSADARFLIRNYMMERFLERISLSAYKDKFILKGGMLVGAMVGLNARSTMDIDTTVKGETIGMDEVTKIITEIISVPIDDEVKFHIKSVSEIMDEAEYTGIRVSMETRFDGTVTPLKIDISTGDIITPHEILYSFKLMFEDRTIDLWAYNLETILAEKLETIVARTVTNTRMRDFYDIHILCGMYSDSLNATILKKAFTATVKRRGSATLIQDADAIIDEVEQSPVMENLWSNYCRKYNYAASIPWHSVMASVRRVYSKIT